MSTLSEKFNTAFTEMSRVIVGQKELLQTLQIAALADGHLLLEGLPGVAKTLAVTTFAKVLDCDYKRIQFTPDLLPADLIGTMVFNPKEGVFSVHQGPIFTNILLADEINRSPAKVQAALLEVMQERQVTIGGTTYKTKSPYLVLATQNPVEQEGTYPLPEAQIDRFMLKIKIPYPTFEEEGEIVRRMATLEEKPQVNAILSAEEILAARKEVNQVHIDPKITNYLLRLVFATRDPGQFGLASLKPLLAYGVSPRASLFLVLASKAKAFLEGRGFVIPEDVKAIAPSVLRHRIKPTFEAEAEEISPDELLQQILNKISLP